ncbi:MAG TPA: NADH-quinone oxidoreductase subunit I [Candidatus Kapabacteria bacterium]|nr:NADH-quinone oxidoreductase subunit I [Candidatus Kapabacteria bacterium]
MAGYFTDIKDGLGTALKGMSIVMKHLLKPKVTRQYPNPSDRFALPERARNRLYVNMDDCIGCDQCARACPVNCITIDTAKQIPGENLGTTSQGKKKSLWVTRFDIDIAKCCYCGLCTYPCPTECIRMTDVYEFSEFDRVNLIYNYATMSADDAVVHTANAKKDEERLAAERAKQAEEKAKAPAAATAPAAPQAGGVKPPPFAAGGVKPPPFKAK